MSLLDRVNAGREEQRTVAVPWQPWDSPWMPFSAGGPTHPAQVRAGLEASLRLAPLYAGARLLADMVASLPLQQYRKTPGGSPVKLPSSSLFDKPAAYGTVYDWLHQCMVSLVLQGNAWGLITERDGFGYPVTIEWLPADRVIVEDDKQQPWNPLRARVYFFGAQMNRADLFHVRAFTVPGKTEGLSPLRLFMETIEAGQSALEYGTSWFRNGGFPPGTFQNQELEVSKEQSDEIKKRLTDAIRTRQPLVYGRDWDYKPVTVPPSEAQFIEAMQLNATQIAAILGLPPERIGGKRGDSLTYSTQEQESISLITDTLRPWLVRLETAFFDALPSMQYVRFNTAAMLKTTTVERYQVYKLSRDMGLQTVGELRELEELPPMQGAIDDDPLPLEVLVAMARGIKEIPKSFEKLVVQGPADAAAQASQEKVAASRPAIPPGMPVPPPPAADAADTAAEPAAEARWLAEYQIEKADTAKARNGSH